MCHFSIPVRPSPAHTRVKPSCRRHCDVVPTQKTNKNSFECSFNVRAFMGYIILIHLTYKTYDLRQQSTHFIYRLFYMYMYRLSFTVTMIATSSTKCAIGSTSCFHWLNVVFPLAQRRVFIGSAAS